MSQSPDTSDPSTGGAAAAQAAVARLRRLSCAVYIYWPCNPGFNPHHSSAAPLSLDEQPWAELLVPVVGGQHTSCGAGRVSVLPHWERLRPPGAQPQSSAYDQHDKNLESHWRKQVQGLRHRALLPLDSARSPSSLVPFLTLDRDRDVAPHL